MNRSIYVGVLSLALVTGCSAAAQPAPESFGVSGGAYTLSADQATSLIDSLFPVVADNDQNDLPGVWYVSYEDGSSLTISYSLNNEGTVSNFSVIADQTSSESPSYADAIDVMYVLAGKMDGLSDPDEVMTAVVTDGRAAAAGSSFFLDFDTGYSSLIGLIKPE